MALQHFIRDSSARSQLRHIYPKQPAWLWPPALSISQAISFSCQMPPKTWVTPWGGEGILNHKGLKLSFLPAKRLYSFAFRHRSLRRCTWVPHAPALASGQHSPQAHSPLGPGGRCPWGSCHRPALSQLLPWLLPSSVCKCHRPSESPFLSSALGRQPAHMGGSVQQWPGARSRLTLQPLSVR